MNRLANIVKMLLVLCVAVVPVVVSAQVTHTIAPSDDMYTDPDNPTGHAAGELWTADWAPINNYQRINMRFDLQEVEGENIESATLHLYRFFGCPSGDPTVTSFHCINQQWDENSWPENVHVACDDEVWANYVFSVNGWHEIDLTNLVQSWSDGTLGNYGFVIIADASKFTKCYSKEASNADQHPWLEVITEETTVSDDGQLWIPDDFAFEAFPNPFNSMINFGFTLSQSQPANLSVYNMLGETVAEIHCGMMSAGRQQVSYHPEGLASGVYYIRMQAGSQSVAKRIVLLQ